MEQGAISKVLLYAVNGSIVSMTRTTGFFLAKNNNILIINL